MSELDIAAQLLERATSALRGAEIEVAVDRYRLSLTRFANSVIHQNVAEDTTVGRVRIHHDGRTASASSTLLDDEGMAALLARSIEAVRVAPRDPGWPGLAPPAEPAPTSPVDTATAEASPGARAEIVGAFVDAAGGLEAAGYCRTNHWSGAFVNSSGQEVIGAATECGLAGIARQAHIEGRFDGVARHAPRSIADLDGTALGARAAAKARTSVDPIELPPGRYEVVLEPTAVADLIEGFAAYGFNGKAINERRSFVRVGEPQFDSLVTIVDDPPDSGFGYDNEGSPRQRLVLVDVGTSAAVTHDRRSAAEAGDRAESTGHAVGAGPWGPYARYGGLLPKPSGGIAHESVDGPAADAAVSELVAGVKRGVLVTDFWYTRVLDPLQLTVTGLTRNGVWLIEDGEITTPLRNFRFTQSYAQALMPGAVMGVGRTATPVPIQRLRRAGRLRRCV
jgi:predicted Zn-dependent protease